MGRSDVSRHTCTHLRGPPVLSYGHFGSNWSSTNQRSSAANTLPTAPSANQIDNSRTDALPGNGDISQVP